MPPKIESEADQQPARTMDLPRPSDKARLVCLAGRDYGRVYRVRRDVLIGRDKNLQVQVDSPDVSRRHAHIWRGEDGQWLVEDLGSRNGTFLNSIPIQGRAQLSIGDRIQIGGSLLFMFSHYDQLEEQVRQLQKMESIGQLAGEVAHDFKNLLSVVITNLDYLQLSAGDNTLTKEELLECINEMRDATKRAGELTGKILGFARKGQEEASPTDLSTVAEEVVQMCQRTFNPKIAVEDKIQPELMVMGDSTQLHQVLMNLCINARDAMPDGGRLMVHAESRWLETIGALDVILPAPGEYVVVMVQDTGKGMDEETRARAFDPFFTTKGPKKGTGLGLATVYAAVKNHGGHVALDSEPGAGTTFRIYIPCLKEKPNETAAGIPPMDQFSPFSGEPGQDGNAVLIVDDDQAMHDVITRLLEEIGHEALCASDGVEALTLYEQNRSRVRLVLLDMIMPNLGGEETYQILRRFDPSVRVLLTSGQYDEDEVLELLEAGAWGFLPKPYKREDFQRSVREALGEGKDPGELDL
jgi:signal transduction histidine kinase/ActR/RegA family two-component response regulator